MNDCDVTDLGPIDAVRHFNRFYTRQLGFLEEGLLRSDFTLTEARILYELAHRDEATATEMCDELGLDAGYFSRILKKFVTSIMVVDAAEGTPPKRRRAKKAKKAVAAAVTVTTIAGSK